MSHNLAHYFPEMPPDTGDRELGDWARREFEKIAAMLEAPNVPIFYAAPSKPRDGQLVRADGTEWDPGSARGIYIFDEDVWKLVLAL